MRDQEQVIFWQNLKSKWRTKNTNLNLIGQFGVGFFILHLWSGKVTVISRKAGSSKCFRWTSDGTSGYEIHDVENMEIGTSITLQIKSAAKEFLDDTALASLQKNTLTIFPIQLNFLRDRERKKVS